MISVCIATYNGEKYIKEQLDSIIPQLGHEDEIVISDDGSSDSTLDIINSINDKRIRITVNQGKHGVNSNFNNALLHAKGDFIFLADQDDIWLSGKVAECLKALEKADLVMHDAIITDYSLSSQNKTLFCELNIKGGFVSNLIRNRFTGCCIAFRKEILEYILPIPDSTLFFHDNWIGLMCELKGTVKFIPFKGIYFRRHPDTNSTAGKGKGMTLSRKIRSRISLLSLTLKRFFKK